MQIDPYKRVLELAAKSPCHNRKVGAVLLSVEGKIVGEGYNTTPDGSPCEDAAGATEAHVVHAEEMCIANHFNGEVQPMPVKMLVTHQPCATCQKSIYNAFGPHITIEVVGKFMKFDSDKLRFDLIPNEWHVGDAEILTHGAKKYKPNNWRHVEDIGRYLGALERHLAAFKQAVEEGGDFSLFLDSDSGLHHMKHLRTNAGFLLTLTENEFAYLDNRNKGLFINLEIEQ